jgi:hypothetical protein
VKKFWVCSRDLGWEGVVVFMYISFIEEFSDFLVVDGSDFSDGFLANFLVCYEGKAASFGLWLNRKSDFFIAGCLFCWDFPDY